MTDVEVNGVEKSAEEKSVESSPVKELKDNMEEEEEEEEEEKEVETEESVSDLEKQIIRQIEYYFGDINLPRDKFLLEQIKLDDGWIPLEIMLKFKRLANLSTDVEVIVAAIKKSKSELLEISGDKKKIRRSPKKVLPQQNEERRKELQGRTVYCKGFPLDSTLDSLLEYFQKYGAIDSIIMRQYRDKSTKTFHFKGSVFVLFASKEKAEEFLKLEEVKFGETELIRLWQSVYNERKKEERKTKPKKDDEDGDNKPNAQEQEAKGFPKGTVLGLKGELGKLVRDDIKAKVEELGAKVAFVNCNSGDEGWVRLLEENSAKEVMEKLEDGKLVINEIPLEARVLDGEEEDTLLKQAMADMMKIRRSIKLNMKGKRGGRGGGRGGFNNRKRKVDNAADGPPKKQDRKQGAKE